MDFGPDRLEAVILAGGKGTRMGGGTAVPAVDPGAPGDARPTAGGPKVLAAVAGRPMVEWVVTAAEEAGCGRSVIVVGYEGERVKAAVGGVSGRVFVEQREQLGTGHAVMQAAQLFQGKENVDVLVLCGDGPLIRADTLRRLVEAHRSAGASATLATAILEDPTGYGRIVRDEGGRFVRIVEHKDATEAERAIREVNPSYYCFRAEDLFDGLGRIGNDNAKGEYYLTDVLGVLVGDGKRVEVVEAVPAEDVLSINTPEQLAEVERLLLGRAAGAGERADRDAGVAR